MADDFAPYSIVRELGRGGMGVVYEVRHPEVARPLALKVVLADGVADAPMLERFGNEARLLGRVRHPGVVGIHAFGRSAGGRPYLVADLVEGESLQAIVKRTGPLAPERAIGFTRQLALAVHAIHEQGIVHRDLKPENAIVGAGDRVVLLDFGLARELGGERLTRTGEVVGTPAYMSPEQASGERGAADDPRTDVYALGAILWFLLAGRAPFEGPVAQVVVAVIRREPDPAPLAGAPPALVALVRRAMAKDPAARFESAAAFAEALAAWSPGASGGRRGLALAAVGAAAVLATVAAAATRSPPAPAPIAPPASPPPRSPPPRPAPAAAIAAPEWYRSLPDALRPRLPDGIVATDVKAHYRNEKDGSVLVWVPARTFDMGADPGAPDEQPVHRVKVSGFFLGRVEVSNKQFAVFARSAEGAAALARLGGGLRTRRRPDRPEAEPIDRGASFAEPWGPGSAWRWVEDHPVVQVTWLEAVAYCRWAGLRLPTEAQWEAAARPQEGGPFPWGDAPIGRGPLRANVRDRSIVTLRDELHMVPDRAYGDYDDGWATTAPVDSFPEGAAWCGALHMVGNVRELCDEGYDERTYERVSRGAVDPWVDSTKTERILVRGGDWAGGPAKNNVHARTWAHKNVSCDDMGFRVAWSAR